MAEMPGRVTAEDGSRFYPWTDPETGVEHQFWSVTTALTIKAKDGLKWWAAQLSSRRAMENLPKLIASQRVEPCGRSHARNAPLGCDRCPDCMRRWLELYHLGESTRRKHEGSAVHDALEAWIKKGVIPPAANLGQPYIEEHPKVVEMLPPYLEQLERWIGDYALQPEDFLASEMKIFNTVHRYGGTLDLILWLKARNLKSAKMVARVLGRPGTDCKVVGDAKTREGEGKALYDEHALQMAAYRHANFCQPVRFDPTLVPMIPTHGAVVFQPRPDGYTFEPVVTDEETFKTFLNYLSAFQWQVDHGKASIRIDSFPVPQDFDPKSPPVWSPAEPVPTSDSQAPEAIPAKKAAPRKRATKKTSPPAAPLPTSDSASPRGPSSGSARMAGATLESITRTGDRRPGYELRDEDIPF